jgi:hypothetical protein
MTFVMPGSFRTVLVIACLMLAPLVAGAGESFLTAIEDVPLAPGLAEQANGGMVFDSPTGRIVEAAASGPISVDQVKAFYAQTLPQLGWSDAGKMTFRRDSEILRIAIEAGPQKGAVLVRFNLAPNR